MTYCGRPELSRRSPRAAAAGAVQHIELACVSETLSKRATIAGGGTGSENLAAKTLTAAAGATATDRRAGEAASRAIAAADTRAAYSRPDRPRSLPSGSFTERAGALACHSRYPPPARSRVALSAHPRGKQRHVRSAMWRSRHASSPACCHAAIRVAISGGRRRSPCSPRRDRNSGSVRGERTTQAKA